MSRPRILPLFPLTGSLLLPGGLLPLHVFETRYCNLVRDALDEHAMLGIIQPRTPDPDDNHGAGSLEQVELYSIGCIGLLDQVQELPKGRYLVILKGLGRFRMQQELHMRDGYRRAEVTYDEFEIDDLDVDAEVDASPLLQALERFGSSQGLELNMDKLEQVSGLALMNGLAMNLPFAAAEKQALLEASDARQRHGLLLSLLDMGFAHDNLTTH